MAVYTDTIGASQTTNNSAGNLRAYSIIASQNGALQSLGINLNAAAGTLRLGIYNAWNVGSDSKLRGLLGQSALTSPSSTGWVDLSVTGTIVQGTTYYLAYDASSASLVWNESNSKSTRYYAAHNAALPFTDPSETLSTGSFDIPFMRMTYSSGQTQFIGPIRAGTD